LVVGFAVYQYTLPSMLFVAIIDPPKQMANSTLNGSDGRVSLADF